MRHWLRHTGTVTDELYYQGSYSSSKSKIPRLFPGFSSQSHNIPRPILPHISVPKTCNNLQHQRVLLRHADFTISYDSVPRFLTFFSYTHFTCCLKFGKISSIHSVTDTFSIYSSLLIPDFAGEFAFSLTLSRFPRPVGILIILLWRKENTFIKINRAKWTSELHEKHKYERLRCICRGRYINIVIIIIVVIIKMHSKWKDLKQAARTMSFNLQHTYTELKYIMSARSSLTFPGKLKAHSFWQPRMAIIL